MIKSSSILLLLLIFSGCAQSLGTYSIASSFNPQNAKFILEQGTSTIKGQAFLKTVGGDVKSAAGNTATLVPVTAYSTERFNFIYGNRKTTAVQPKFKNTDPQYVKYTRQVKIGIDGKFTFNNVAEGNYFITTAVTWGVPSSGGYIRQQGGAIYDRVVVPKGKVVEVILSGR